MATTPLNVAALLLKIPLFHKVSFSMFFQQDTVIFERLQDKQMYLDSTVEHLEEFAKEGKRTASTILVKSFSVSPNSV